MGDVRTDGGEVERQPGHPRDRLALTVDVDVEPLEPARVKGRSSLVTANVSHYDTAPPEEVTPEELERLRDADRFRFANRLEAWIEVEDGRIVRWGQDGGGMIGSTTLRLGGHEATFAPVSLPDLRKEPEVGDGWVRFVQTSGGRTGVPTPRRVKAAPFVQIRAPLAWTTVSLVLHADGRSEIGLDGASPFPRHWLYDGNGRLSAKSGLVEFDTWYRKAFGKHSPWGDEDTPALVTARETALERMLSEQVMRGGQSPSIERLKAGDTLTEQGEAGTDLFLLLDGVLTVEVDGQVLADLGPGAIVGERALLEGGRRTSTLRATTASTVARCRPNRSTGSRWRSWPVATGGRTSCRPAVERAPQDERRQYGDGAAEGWDRMRVYPLGVRGSTPAPGASFVRHGGHTSSVAIAHDTGPPTLVLDAGTGIRTLPSLLDGEAFRGDIFLSHLHWDHTQGLPFCPAIDRDDAEVDLWVPAQDGVPAFEMLARAPSPPHFPIDPDGLRGRWRLHDLHATSHTVGGFSVTAAEVPHKGGRTFGSGSATGPPP